MFGVIAKVLKPLEEATVALLCWPVPAQLMSYHAPSTSMASLNVIDMVASKRDLSRCFLDQ